MRKRHNMILGIEYAVLIIIGISFAIPALWLILAAFNRTASLSIELPHPWTLENFKAIFSKSYTLVGFRNSLVIALAVTAITDVTSLLAAYPLSRFKLKAGNKISLLLLFLTALPQTALMLSSYQLAIKLHIIDSLIGIILMMAAMNIPYSIWMMKNFLDSISVELEEAAWVDGASKMQTILHIIVPLMMPGFFTVTTWNFVSAWGNFYTPFILLQSEGKFPASVNIYRLYGLNGEVIFGQVAAYSILYIIPILVLYYFSQDYMSKGFGMSGAMKG